MKIRIIQLINNFFKDGDRCEGQDKEKALGTYCTFGYFDALQVKESKFPLEAEEDIIWKGIDEVAVNTLDGTCSRRNLICIAEDEEKDKQFWDSSEQYPYLFVSLIRVKHSNEAMEVMHRIIDDIKEQDMVISYYSYNHSELVIAKVDNYYYNGIDFVLSLRKELDILNIYSIFSVRENVLKSEEGLKTIQREQIDVRLHLMIKSDDKVNDFLQTLWEELYKEKIQSGMLEKKEHFSKYYTLGSGDMLLEIKQMEMQKLLSCYSMGKLLTHTNSKFCGAVYNIETEILTKESE